MKKHAISIAIAATLISPSAMSDVIIKLGAGVKGKDEEKDISFQLGGRVQWDYNYASFDDGADEAQVTAGAGVGEVTDESDLDIRRARIYVKGDVADWGYKAQFNIKENEEEDFITEVDGNDTDASNDIDEIDTDDGSARTDDGGTVEDLYIQYKGWGSIAKLTIGKQKEPIGLEELTSSKDISFLERSAITEAYAQGRNVGVKVSGDFGFGVYDFGLFEDGSGSKSAGRVAATGRVVFNPLKTDNTVFHVGLAHSERAYDVSVSGLELAFATGPFHAQAEYMEADNGLSGAAKVETDGSYLQLGYIITGESRPYSGGKFKRVKPEGGWGAFEVVARYDVGEGNYSDIELGRTDATSYGLGVNWYANNYVRLGMTYSIGEEKSKNALGNHDKGEEFRFRTQFAF